MGDIFVKSKESLEDAFTKASDGDRIIVDDGAILPFNQNILVDDKKSIEIVFNIAGTLAPFISNGPESAFVEWPSSSNIQFQGIDK